MLRQRLFFIVCLFYFLPSDSCSQTRDTFKVAFWNVENLFDTERDSLKHDEEFQPASIRGWHWQRYKKKLADVARVITAIGEWTPPALVGVCEVENHRVLNDLTRYAPLRELHYNYVMTESADLRGIDVALLYQRHQFKVLSCVCIRPDPGGNDRPTRDLLHVTGLTPRLDTLDVFVVHFPSRAGGAKASEPRRLKVAALLKATTDSLVRVRREPRILIMGDFNDYPHNKAITKTLQVQLPDDEPKPSVLYHLLSRRIKEEGGKKKDGSKPTVSGSYKYQGEWGLLDHLIVSGLLLDRTTGFYTEENKAGVFAPPFLLTDDEKFGGKQPFRTYNGMKYQGGYSDHLPVYADFELIFETDGEQ